MTAAIDVMPRLYAQDAEVGHVAAVQEMVAGMEPWVRFAEGMIARLPTPCWPRQLGPKENHEPTH